VTQLDFTGPHPFLSRTPDLHVRVASLSGQSITADRLTFSNLDDLGAIESCDVDRALPDFGLLRVAHFRRCRVSHRPPCGLPLGMAGFAFGLRCHR
jgi:hypothetical protein